MTRRGAFPGSFNPPTTAHLAIAAAARSQHHLERVDLVVSRVALAKEHVDAPRWEDRIAVLTQVVAAHDWLGLVTTDAQLIADLADGYDVVVLGADKWAQLHDVRFYGGDPRARDAALARLPTVAVAPRGPLPVPDELRLEVEAHDEAASSTMARRGARDLMLPAALAFDESTGAWTDPARYERWLTGS